MKMKHYFALLLVMSVFFTTACNNKYEQQKQSTISVLGTGTVLVQPDMLQVSITLSNLAQTTKMAQDEVSRMVRQVLAILKNENIEDKNITTASLNFRSEYEHYGRSVLLGQRAEQKIAFSIDDLNDDNEKISRIIDQLIMINGIALNHINFNIKNNTEYFVRSRELAFQKAVEKANQYAELSGLKIIKVLTLSEEGNQLFSPMQQNRFLNSLSYEMEAVMDTGSTIIPTGELEITTRISVVFLLK